MTGEWLTVGGLQADWAARFLGWCRESKPQPDLIFHTSPGEATVGSHWLLWAGLLPSELRNQLGEAWLAETAGELHISWPDVDAAQLAAFCRGLESLHPETARWDPPDWLEDILGRYSRLGWSCSECQQWFGQKKLLNRHLRTVHDPDNPFRCPQCGRSCRSRSELLAHERVHGGVEPPTPPSQAADPPFKRSLACRLCNKVLATSYALKLHEGVHAGARDFECEQCGKRFAQKSHLTVHLRSHDGSQPFMCPVCGRQFSISSNLKRHLLSHEHEPESELSLQLPDQPAPSVSQATGPGDLSCPTCDRHFAGQALLKAHASTHQPPPCLLCSKCDLSFPSRSQLKAHEKAHTGDPQFLCPVCRRVCGSRSELDKHTLIHTGDRPHPCSFCTKRFVQKSHVNHHMRTVHADHVDRPLPRTYPCPMCAKAFSSNSIMQKHVKIHTNDRPHSCSLCGKAFIQKAHLQTHLLRHSGAKPFLCGYCGKCFTTKSNLGEHAKTHTGAKKKFPCSTCESTYSNLADLKVHQRHHTGETPFECPQCGKAFRARRHLEQHTRIHAGLKPFSCQNCKKAFTTPSGLEQHFKRHGTCKLTASAGAYSLEAANDLPELFNLKESISVDFEPTLAEAAGVDGLLAMSEASSILLDATL
eukprot:snap_masked-scaffold1048_size67263-processed-gene-0.1 protein:Tk10018 transcript:snap_masked-scaffold1048_size67263-processed-gene-0.1-mRNA-1 annotation:"zinc finger protein 585a isoform 2"